jgi:hypothetical protein
MPLLQADNHHRALHPQRGPSGLAAPRCLRRGFGRHEPRVRRGPRGARRNRQARPGHHDQRVDARIILREGNVAMLGAAETAVVEAGVVLAARSGARRAGGGDAPKVQRECGVLACQGVDYVIRGSRGAVLATTP